LIYQPTPPDAPVRQGDIFISMPRVDLPSLKALTIVDEEGNEVTKAWREVARAGQTVAVAVGLRPVTAIVTTQDCDAVRAPEIVLCEIQPFDQVEGRAKNVTSPKRLADLITQHARINQKWFYLPPDQKMGFNLRMAADFRITLRVLRDDLEALRDLRIGRLNDVAEAHFRERLGEFSRRYAYDEWYSLSDEELKEYCNGREGVQPYPWQNKKD
jgi:hypothetical protein